MFERVDRKGELRPALERRLEHREHPRQLVFVRDADGNALELAEYIARSEALHVERVRTRCPRMLGRQEHSPPASEAATECGTTGTGERARASGCYPPLLPAL